MDQNNNQRAIRNIVSELGASSGGSLVKHIHKLQLTRSGSVLFIGLGGLGSKTVNAIKSIYMREFEPAENIRFLAVDTDMQSQDNITIGHEGGAMSGEELFQIFDSSAVNLLTNPPPQVQSWLGQLTAVTLNGDGAKGVRQIGRIMLCGTQKYSQLRQKISGLVNEIHSDSTPVNVVVVAGISGGTGSGTFIDISYMVRDILSGLIEHDHSVKQYGVFYTPEVQHSIPDIQNSAAKWHALCRNGYAAFKELDYFMSNGSMRVGARPIYRLVTVDGSVVESAEPIYDNSKAFIVSCNGRLNDCDDIVNAAARSLLNMFQDVNAVGGAQSILSTFSNTDTTTLPTWRTMKVGQPLEGKTEDPMGIENSEFPVFMNYIYSAFGYSSVYFPRDEIMAYCANEVLTKIYDVWKSASILSQRSVNQLIHNAGLFTMEQIVSGIKESMGVNTGDLRIDEQKDSGSWPKVDLFLFGRGRVNETALTMTCAGEKAKNEFDKYNNPERVATIARRLAEKLTNLLGTEKFITNYGPFAAIAALTGYGELRGACNILDNMRGQLEGAQKTATKEMEEKLAIMQQQAGILENDNTPTTPEIKVFIDACEDYSIAYFDYLIYSQMLPRVLPQVRANLQRYNNQTFEIYVPVMEALTKMLNDDATFFAETNHTVTGNTQHFNMDAYGISESEAKRELFERLFRGYIDNDRVGSVAKSFAYSMFGDPTKREKWAKFADAPEALAEEIRDIFENFFKPFVDDLLEKFVVLAYAGDRIGNLTPQRLDEIWNAAPGTVDEQIKNTAIDDAATAIANVLEGEGAVLVNLEPGTSMLQKLDKSVSLILLESMTALNPAIISKMTSRPSVGYIGNDYKSVICSVRFSDPVALPLVKKFKEYAQCYFDSTGSIDTKAGRHLDECGENWVEYLPEPFGMDAESYYKANGREDLKIDHRLDGNNDLQQYEKIRAAITEGVEKQYIFFDDTEDKCYKLICAPSSTDGFATFRQAAAALLRKNPAATLRDCLKKTNEDYHTVAYEEVLLTCNNNPLTARQEEEPEDPRKFSNLCRIVRSNMRSIRAVLAAGKQFEDSGVLEALAEARGAQARSEADQQAQGKYKSRVALFADMLMCGLAEYRPDDKAWYYRRRKISEFEQLCKLNLLQADTLEEKLTLFLGFGEGIWALDDRVCEVIKEECDRLMEDDDFTKQTDIIAEAKAILSTDVMTEPLEDERDKKLITLRNNSRTKHQAAYSVPKQFDGASSVYENIKGFYEDMIKKLNVAK